MVGENTTNNNNIQNETGDLTAVQIGVWDQETVHKGNMVGYHNTEVWDQNTVHKGDTAGYLNTDMKDKAGALTAVHNSSMVGKHTTASNNKKVVDQTSVHKGNKEGDHTAVHIKVDVESAEVKCVKYVNAEGDSVKTKNNKMGDKVEDKHTVYKDKVGDLNTVHINDGGGHALFGARPDVGHQGVSLPHHTDGGHSPTDDATAGEQFAMMDTFENAAVEPYYAKSTGVENDKTNRNKELPRHNALSPHRCPEDSMGGDLVEGPVVLLSTWYGSGSLDPAS